MADITITGHGSYNVESQTEEGAAWLWSNVSEAESLGDGAVGAYIDGTRYAQDIADSAVEEGLAVICNGVLYEA